MTTTHSRPPLLTFHIFSNRCQTRPIYSIVRVHLIRLQIYSYVIIIERGHWCFSFSLYSGQTCYASQYVSGFATSSGPISDNRSSSNGWPVCVFPFCLGIIRPSIQSFCLMIAIWKHYKPDYIIGSERHHHLIKDWVL
jgi:hypothetical protein